MSKGLKLEIELKEVNVPLKLMISYFKLYLTDIDVAKTKTKTTTKTLSGHRVAYLLCFLLLTLSAHAQEVIVLTFVSLSVSQ